jgi:quinol-cytochrome oxidoreductase complex cytochrome b subunit
VKVRRWGVSGVLNVRGEWETEKFREVSKGPEKKETFKPKKGVSFLIFFFFFFFFFFFRLKLNRAGEARNGLYPPPSC